MVRALRFSALVVLAFVRDGVSVRDTEQESDSLENQEAYLSQEQAGTGMPSEVIRALRAAGAAAYEQWLAAKANKQEEETKTKVAAAKIQDAEKALQEHREKSLEAEKESKDFQEQQELQSQNVKVKEGHEDNLKALREELDTKVAAEAAAKTELDTVKAQVEAMEKELKELRDKQEEKQNSLGDATEQKQSQEQKIKDAQDALLAAGAVDAVAMETLKAAELKALTAQANAKDAEDKCTDADLKVQETRVQEEQAKMSYSKAKEETAKQLSLWQHLQALTKQIWDFEGYFGKIQADIDQAVQEKLMQEPLVNSDDDTAEFKVEDRFDALVKSAETKRMLESFNKLMIYASQLAKKHEASFLEIMDALDKEVQVAKDQIQLLCDPFSQSKKQNCFDDVWDSVGIPQNFCSQKFAGFYKQLPTSNCKEYSVEVGQKGCTATVTVTSGGSNAPEGLSGMSAQALDSEIRAMDPKFNAVKGTLLEDGGIKWLYGSDDADCTWQKEDGPPAESDREAAPTDSTPVEGAPESAETSAPEAAPTDSTPVEGAPESAETSAPEEDGPPAESDREAAAQWLKDIVEKEPHNLQWKAGDGLEAARTGSTPDEAAPESAEASAPEAAPTDSTPDEAAPKSAETNAPEVAPTADAEEAAKAQEAAASPPAPSQPKKKVSKKKPDESKKTGVASGKDMKKKKPIAKKETSTPKASAMEIADNPKR